MSNSRTVKWALASAISASQGLEQVDADADLGGIGVGLDEGGLDLLDRGGDRGEAVLTGLERAEGLLVVEPALGVAADHAEAGHGRNRTRRGLPMSRMRGDRAVRQIRAGQHLVQRMREA